AGVHALAQTAHLDLLRAAEPEIVRSALNHHVKPAAVSVLAVEEVPDSFDARRSAKGRVYRYRILNRPAAGAGAWPRLACRPAPRRRGNAGSRAISRRQARLHQLPRHHVPGEIAGED